MRILPLIAAACVAASGSASAQSFLQPSQLAPAPYGRPLTWQTAPQPEPLAMTEAPDQPHPPVPPRPKPQPQRPDSMFHDGAACDNCGMGGNGCCGPTWFGSVTGLIMSRDENDDIELTTPGGAGNEVIELLNGNSAAQDDWQGGFEVTVGRYLGCDSRVAATYWTLDPVENSASVVDPASNLVTALNVNGLNFGAITVGAIFDGAQLHALRRSSEFHNVEVNFWHDAPVGCCGQSWRLSAMTGFRYFRFTEDFAFSADNTATYAIDVENNLIGWQLGLRTDYQPTCCLSLFADMRFGVYYNYIDHRTTLQNNAGAYATDQFGQGWNIGSHKDDFSTLAQLDLGGRWQMSCNWSVFGGYRLVAASGVALSTEQIPYYLADYYGIRNIDTTGHLFLHGAFAGVEFRR